MPVGFGTFGDDMGEVTLVSLAYVGVTTVSKAEQFALAASGQSGAIQID